MNSITLHNSDNGVNNSNGILAEGVASGRKGDGATQVVIKRNPHPSTGLLTPTRPLIIQLNVEGIARAKCEILRQLCVRYSISVILLQETHTRKDDEIKIYGYDVVEAIHDTHHGIATLARSNVSVNVYERQPQQVN